MTEPQTTRDVEAAVPTAVDAESSKLVYLALDEMGGATIEELTGTLDMKKLSLYSILGSLDDEGLVEQDGETYRLVD